MKRLHQFSFVVVALMLLVGIAACGAPSTTSSTKTKPATQAKSQTTSPFSSASASGAASAKTPGAASAKTSGAADTNAAAQQTGGETLGTLEFHAFDIGFKPATLDVAKPGRYTIKLINDGAIPHDITFENGPIVANAGETKEGVVEVPAEGLNFICSVPGHAPAGMKGVITVAGTAAESEHGGNAGGDHGGPPPATDVQPDPNAPKYTPFDAAAPKAMEGTTHDIDLVIEEKEMTVAEGFVQKVWTFGGTVPGPVIRVKVGDTVRVHLKNPATSQLPHSIDFHSSQVAWDDEMTSINPGEEKLYEWKADYAGVWMYHCGTAPGLHHIANGMYGMVIVEPDEGLPQVDKEFALVQSEWYLGPQKDVTSLEKATVGAPSPDYVVFNGVANQYKDNPLKVGTGERVRFFVLNAGPSMDSSFHIVGTIFDSVIKEGVHLTRDNPGHYGSQAVDLAPAQGAIVELTTAEDGHYPIVTHAFNFVGRGALGMLQAGDGDPKN
jgi:nitrite reductase (NO-forming)